MTVFCHFLKIRWDCRNLRSNTSVKNTASKLIESLFRNIVSFSTGSVIDTGENTEVKINSLPVPEVEKSVKIQGFEHLSKSTAYIRYKKNFAFSILSAV
jgi:hypothetical protein